MLLIPLIYLKNGKVLSPSETRPAWFQENPLALARFFVSQGVEQIYLNDLNVPTTGKGENFAMIESIRQDLKLQIWVTGNFRSQTVIQNYVELGADKVVLGAAAYQDPNLLNETTQKYPQKIAVVIEVRNKHVVIPGMVAPSHKTAVDYARRFEEEKVAALCYLDNTTTEASGDGYFDAIKDFCKQTQVPVLAIRDIAVMQDLEKLFECESAGLMGIVIGKPLYENRIDIHSAIAFLNDLASASSHEITLRP